MTELSPAAQAVLTAYNQRELAAKRTTALAAALRAAADQIKLPLPQSVTGNEVTFWQGHEEAVEKLLDIASELDSQ